MKIAKKKKGVEKDPDNAKYLEEAGRLCKELAAAQREIDRQKRIARIGEEQEELFRRVVEHLPQPVFIVRRGRPAFANNAFAGSVGIAPNEIENLRLVDFLSEQSMLKLQEVLADKASGASAPGGLEIEIIHREGTVKSYAVARVDQYRHTDGLTVVVTCGHRPDKDGSDTELFSEQQLHAQQLQTLGTMAGGIAHDMNNILGAIMSIASVLRQNEKDEKAPDARIDDLDNVLAAARRGRDLTRNLLDLAKKGTGRKENISLNHVAQRVQELLGRTVSKNIEWKLDLDPGLMPVKGDFGQLCHVLINICLNGVDAMEKGGTLTITTQSSLLSPGDSASMQALPEGPYSVLEVRDTGAGMDAKTLRRVFEPFFTTKSKGKGTGLGLAMVHSSVKHHGGAVRIQSRPGTGTIVRVYLPTAATKQLSTRTDTNLRTFRHLEPGLVLLVDDEDLIRKSAKRILELLGYEVVLASSGDEAVSVFEQYRNKLVLVILDLIMPGMDGETAFYRLRELDPDIPVLVASGYAQDEGVVERLLDSGAAGFVQKPFDIQALSTGILIARQS